MTARIPRRLVTPDAFRYAASFARFHPKSGVGFAFTFCFTSGRTPGLVAYPPPQPSHARIMPLSVRPPNPLPRSVAKPRC